MKLIIQVVSLFILYLSSSYSKNLTTAAEFLTWGVGARASGMAEALSAIPSSLSLFYNPAGLAYLHHKEVLLMHTPLYANIGIKDMYHEYLSYTQKNMGIGIIYTPLGKHQNSLSDAPYLPEDKTSFSWVDYAIIFGLSDNVMNNNRLSVGIALKLITSNIRHVLREDESGYEDVRVSTLAADIGILYKLADYLNFALAVNNLGQDLRYTKRDSLPENLPSGVKLGLSYMLHDDKSSIILGGELHYTAEEIFTYNLGLEFKTGKLSLRGGYYDKGGGLSGLSFGAGIRIKNSDFDFAYTNIPGGELSSCLRSSLSLSF